MTLPEPPKPANLIEEQQLIAQHATLAPPLKIATLLIELGIRKYRNILIKL